MKLEAASPPLHDFGTWLFGLIRSLGGADGGEPVHQEGSGWYRAPARGKVCLYVYFAGVGGRSTRTRRTWRDCGTRGSGGCPGSGRGTTGSAARPPTTT